MSHTVTSLLYHMVRARLRGSSYLCVVDALVHLPDETEHEQLPVLTRHVRKALFQCVLLVVTGIKVFVTADRPVRNEGGA